ncbi:MAG: hypothetical protein EOP54_24565 [Sphingobacteriales bacterium]|nr:MAG: hypothetical protein EOP54_24565 [Sphingobacteriales bacterium]
MCKHEMKYCPRCQAPFECKVGSINLCQCSGIRLTPEETEFMNANYTDCLCAACIKQVKADYHNAQYQNKLKAILGVFYRKST